MPGDRHPSKRDSRSERPHSRLSPPIEDGEQRGRELPHNLQAEFALLGCCLIDGGDTIARCLEAKMRPEAFYSPANRIVFEAMLSMYDRQSAIDTLLLCNELRDRNELSGIGGEGAVESLANYIETTAHAGQFIKIVTEKHLLRRLILTATSTVEQCYEKPGGDIDEFLGTIEQEFHRISEDRHTESAQPISKSVIGAVKIIHKMIENRGEITGISSGFKDLDSMTWGLHPQEMVVLAARPSMGKTSLAMNMAEAVVMPRRANAKAVAALVFSLEMSAEQLAMRLLCSRARVRTDRLRGGFASREEEKQLAQTAVEWKTAPLWIDDSGHLNILELRAKARRLHTRHPLGLVVVDYLQLISGTDARVQREQQIAEISRGLKAMAKELNLPVIVLSQLNRESEREKREPRLSDLRESGSIEQDADVVLLLAKPSDDGTQVAGDTADLIVAKQRNGPVGKVRLTFTREYTRFDDHAPDQS